MADKQKGFNLADVLDDVADVADVSKLDTPEQPKGYLAFAYADIEDIHGDPYNPKVFPLSALEGLMDLILLEGGLQQPLYVEPEGEGWLIKSGHRRHAALAALVKGTDKQPPHPELRSVPIVYRPNANTEALGLVADDLDDDQQAKLLRLLAETRVLIGNMANRQFTAAQLSAAAEAMEAHYVAMAELGYRFPGRLRDQVAQACNISASKVARLKVIREKLVPARFVEAWKADKLPEQSAYALAQMPAMLQEAIAGAYAGDGMLQGWKLEDIRKTGMKHYLSTTVKCPSGEGCTNGKGFLGRDLDTRTYYGVGSCACCVTCVNVTSCKYACPAGKEIAKKKRAETRAENKAERDAEARAKKAKTDFWAGLGERLASACDGDRDVYNAALDELDEKALENCWYDMCHTLPGLAFPDGVKRSGVPYLTVDALTALCRQLNVSADYILGLAEDPLTQLAAAGAPVGTGGKPTWRPMDTPPERSGRYLLKFGFDGVTRVTIMQYNADIDQWAWCSTGTRLNSQAGCLGWYPIPEDDDGEEVENDD